MQSFFQLKFYFRGVAQLRRAFFNPEGLNYEVLLVGYGVEGKRKSLCFLTMF